jgi:hypothetical protein
MLMLTLERIGVRGPATYTALARHAQRLNRLNGERKHHAFAQFQSAVALIARLVTVGTIDRDAAARLLDALAVTPIDARHGYLGAVAVFLARHIGPAIGAGTDVTLDEALVLALSGPPGAGRAAPVSWEGQTYVFDLAGSEAMRLRRFQERGRASLDAAVRLQREAAARTDALDVVDVMTTDALLSFVYAIAVSGHTAAARLDAELPRRHEFGLASRSQQTRARTPWALPRLVYLPGQPGHVEGSVLGLDMALGPLALRRIDSAPPRGEPRLLSTERYSFALSLGLLDVFALRDADAAAVAEAIARGERRVDRLGDGGGDATAIIDELAMDGWRARAIRWNLTHARERVPSLFSLTELFHLGGGDRRDLQPWGTLALSTFGCLCPVVPPPGLQTAFVGRHQLGLLPATVPDLNVRVAVLLHELQLPPALAKQVLESALYDLVTDVRPTHPDDWLTVVRHARALSRDRVADALAAVAATAGPLSPVTSTRRLP